MEPVKKKMKRAAEIAERMEKLRTALGMSQVAFAERIGVAGPRISEWKVGKGVPPAEAYVALGYLAPYPDNLWFLEQAGIRPSLISSIANELVKGRVEIPLAHKTPEGIEETQIVVPLPERFVPNPDSTVCLVVDKKSAGLVFAEGDVVVLEPAGDPQDPQPYWDEIVLCEFTEPNENWVWPEGLFMGRLRCKPYRIGDLYYYATVGPFNDSEQTWAARQSQSIIIGTWQHPGPPKEPRKGSEREKAQAECAAAGTHFEALTANLVQRVGSVINHYDPELVKARQPLEKARERIAAAEAREERDAQDEAKEQSTKKLKLRDGCKIIGRSIAWFRPPRPGRE